VLIALVADGQITPFASAPIFAEYHDVLARSRVTNMLALLAATATLVKSEGTLFNSKDSLARTIARRELGHSETF